MREVVLGTMMCGMPDEETTKRSDDTDAAALLSVELAGEADPEFCIELDVETYGRNRE
ncbi:hypothetical protein MOQ72_03225 [Saccharopolyspora sp. K220]|uniref:hypothetical protein n=1 Tax=Saccharopolyspora soli TaxID=2926618 RepID=UPI001F5A5442|nr:hypothetical protein [Saccharopolyspora soli]MCI2416424.1 hypothetical protein [Saccharopolyspora soli]